MMFNIDKCKVIHFGYNNEEFHYKLGNNELSVGEDERDLGIIIDRSLKPSKQCNKAAASANSTLGMINRTFICKDKDIILFLYKSLVRPKLEYCIQTWCPYLQKDIQVLEKVQRRATRMIDGFSNVVYYERLKLLGLTTLETRRLRGDLLEVFKIFRGFDNIDKDIFFEMNKNDLRGHSWKLFKKRSKLEVRKNFFSNRVVDEWNALPQEVIESLTVSAFKKRLDHHLRFNRGFI